MTRKRAAWVIVWDWFGNTRKPRRLLFHILQPRWKPTRVLEHMKFLYLNSELFLVSERLRFLSHGPWRGLIHMEGPRIIVGDNPCLVGCLVYDLRFEMSSAGQEIVRWTQCPGIKGVTPDHKIEYMGQPFERKFRVSIRGHVADLLEKDPNSR